MRQIGFGWVCGIGLLCAVVGAWPVFGAGSTGPLDPLAADEDPSEAAIDLSKEVPPKAAVNSPSKPQPLAPAESVTVTGQYQVAWLALDSGLPVHGGSGVTNLHLFLGLRDGKCVQAWSCTAAIRFNWFDRIDLEQEGDSIKGEFEGRARGRGWMEGDFKYTIDAKVEGTRVVGSFTGTFGAATLSGKLSGALRTDEELAKDNSIVKDWTSYLGSEGTAKAPDSNWKLVESLDLSRPVWKSEQYTPTGWGSGPDGRYADASYIEGVNGGASTPLVWDKKVYLYYFFPNPDSAREVKVEFNQFVRKTEHPVEIQNLRNFGAAMADDFVLCLDSATGKTLWRTRFPKRLNHGKMRLHMVDADPKTLTVLTESWSAPHPTTTAYSNMGIGVLLLDGRLIVRGQDGIYCYDLRKR